MRPRDDDEEGHEPVRIPPTITRVIALLALLVVAVLLPANVATADKPTPTKQQVAKAQSSARAAASAVGSAQARLATLTARMDRLVRNAEIAGEAYDGAVYRLGLATQAAQQAQRRAALAQARYDAAELVVGRFASAAYRSGADFGPADIFLGVGGPGGAVSRADAIAAVGQSVERALLTAQSAKIVATVMHQQAADALAAQASAEQAVATAKLHADQAAAQQQSKVTSLQSQIAKLRHSLAYARLHAAHLVKARKVGLARAAQQRRLAQERAAAAAAAARRAAESSVASPGVVLPVVATARGTTAGAARAIAYAKRQLGKPYVYAAAGPDSFDCSGLTMRAWQAGGVSLPHWSVAQYEQSQPVSPSQARPGDLVFFASNPNDYRTIYHVALYLGGGMMIEAPHTGDVVKIIAVYPYDLFGYARP